MFESINIKNVKGHVKITDISVIKNPVVLVDQYNAIHFGNLTMAIAKSLAGDQTGKIRWMAFGNGGTSINENGQIDYRVPNVSEFRDLTASLYNETFSKDVQLNNDKNFVQVILSSVNYADIKIVATLDYGEPLGEDILDNATNFDEPFIFDEIALKINDGVDSVHSTLISHIVFSPVQKSLNRVIQIEYTVRIQLG